MQDMGNPFSPIPFQTVQIIPDGVVAILVGNDADGGFDLLFAGDAVFLHPAQNILHVGIVQRLAGAEPAHISDLTTVKVNAVLSLIRWNS